MKLIELKRIIDSMLKYNSTAADCEVTINDINELFRKIAKNVNMLYNIYKKDGKESFL